MVAECQHAVRSGTTLELRPALRFCATCNVMTCDLCGEQFFSNARKYRAQEWPVTFSSSAPVEWTVVHEPIPMAVPCSHS